MEIIAGLWLLGATLSLVGCLLGNLLIVSMVIPWQERVALLDVVLFLVLNVAVTLELISYLVTSKVHLYTAV